MSLTRDEVLAAVDLSSYRDVEVPLLQFEIDPMAERLVTQVDGEQFFVSNDAKESLRKEFDVSGKQAEDIELFRMILNYQARKKASVTGKGKKVLIKDGDEPQVVGFMKHDALQVLDMEGILAAVERGLGGTDLEYTRALGNVDHLSFSVVGPKSGEPVVGDTFRFGIAFDYSATDRFGLGLTLFSHRLVCSNGMYATIEHKGVNRRHIPEDVYSWVSTYAEQLVDGYQTHVDHLSALNQMTLTESHLDETLESIYSEFGVPLAARSHIQSLALARGVRTPYDIMNIITEVATHHEAYRGDVTLQTKLMRSAGNLSSHDAYCNQCERPLSHH